MKQPAILFALILSIASSCQSAPVAGAVAPALPAVQAEADSPKATDGPYIGIKGGPLNISRDLPFNNGYSLGALFGFDFPESDFAFETVVTTTVDSPTGTSDSVGDLDVFTLGFYGVYRTPGDLYFKGKAGLVYEYLNVDFRSLPLEGDAIGLSLGLGGGYRFNEALRLELEYTALEADIALFSLGLLYSL